MLKTMGKLIFIILPEIFVYLPPVNLVCLFQSGVVMVWKADGKGRLQQNPLHQHHCQEPLTQILFRPLPPSDPST